jgi:hypothetical protein
MFQIGQKMLKNAGKHFVEGGMVAVKEPVGWSAAGQHVCGVGSP